jgi:hypothetical protein
MYFKQGLCTKGAKCKFSHDLAIERKAEKRSLYDDVRDNSNKENGLLLKKSRFRIVVIYLYLDTMANWDDAQLAEVVEQRHGEENRKKNATQIVRVNQ